MSLESDKIRSELMSGEIRKLSENESTVVVNGYRACMSGVAVLKNPYRFKHWRKLWRLGWDNAHNDFAGRK